MLSLAVVPLIGSGREFMSLKRSKKTSRCANKIASPPSRRQIMESLERRQLLSVSYTTAGGTYSQNFDTLPTTGTAAAWANDSTIAGWSLFNKTPAAITAVNG